MKILALVLLLFSSGPSINTDDTELAELTKEAQIAAANYLSPMEKAMIWEINLVRSQPQSYIPFVQDEMAQLRADSIRLSGVQSESIKRTVHYVAGVEVEDIDTIRKSFYQDRMTALSELLIELGAAIPIEGLSPSESLYTCAVKHGDSQAEKGYIDHRGIDGSWPADRHLKEDETFQNGNENIVRFKGTPREVVIQLLIDSGVPHRGHRKNILDPQWKYVSCHKVSQLDQGGVAWWIQEFAY